MEMNFYCSSSNLACWSTPCSFTTAYINGLIREIYNQICEQSFQTAWRYWGTARISNILCLMFLAL